MMLRLIPVVVLLLGPTVPFAATPQQKQPNVVLIVSDDQGYRDLGCCGNAGIKTPHLDRLAAAGVRARSFNMVTDTSRGQGTRRVSSY